LVQTGCTAPQFKLEGIGACGRDSIACMLAPCMAPGEAALMAPALDEGSALLEL
jgi:hypothetical protein